MPVPPLLVLASLLAPTPPPPSPPSTFPVDVILNGSFELVADSTTDPPKLGAYWRDAFVHVEGDPTCLVVPREDGAGHALALTPDGPEVSQLTPLYSPCAEEFRLHLTAAFEHSGARLRVRFATQGGRVVEERLAAPDEAGGFVAFELPLGARMEEVTGAGPDAWCRLSLAAEEGRVLVDDVVGALPLPRTSHAELRAALLAELRDVLRIYCMPPDGEPLAGLGLVDGETGYLVGAVHDAQSGEVVQRNTVGAITGIHDLMVRYLRIGDAAPEAAPLVARVRELLLRHWRSVMANNVYLPTGLYCLWDMAAKRQILAAELSPSHFIEYVLDVAALFPEEHVLVLYAQAQALNMAAKMVELRREHDLPRDVPFGRAAGGNWFGRMPEKVSALGVLAPPKKSTYDQAWAISQDRSWYHDFDTAVGLMRAYAIEPRPEFAEAVLEAVRHFDRVYDAQRYDLENDTDDHYGVNVESALRAFRAGGYAVPELLGFAQWATDHRLPHDRPWDESLWVQGIRLGSFTTGDQPRAFRGPVGLHELPPDVNPLTSGHAGYRHAVREITKMDLKRRLLDDGYQTEASSYMWEMISACFLGDYIAPCAEGLEWEGDMGDLFAGPASNGFRALARCIEISRPGEDREFVAWYAGVFAHTAARYRLPYGYLFGMSADTGRRYGIPEKYLDGFTTRNPYWLASIVVHAELLESGALDREVPSLAVVERSRTGDALAVTVAAPAGARVALRASPRERLAPAGPTDWRLLAVDPADPATRAAEAEVPEEGRVALQVAGLPDGPVVADLLLLGPDGALLDLTSLRDA